MIYVEGNHPSDSKFSNKASSTNIREFLCKKDEESNSKASTREESLL
jgi:hypothetical protein